jgi:serine phosphatase RsbU (regulator of sigma subunit)/pSer/pThr/pTyr-binding forkhead associated (FHA) protein
MFRSYPMAVLMKINGNAPPQLIELKDHETVIGRLPECSIVLDRQGVSRRHAQIRRDGENRYVVTDLESRNFTFLNHRQLPALLDHPLEPGDRITICDVELVFYLTPPVAADPGQGIDVYESSDESTLHTVDASRSDVTSSVRPEVKLKAILDINRNLSSNIEIDSAAPRILESLLSIFPQAERSFMVLLKEAGEKPVIRQTFHKMRPPRPGKLGNVRSPLNRPLGDEARMSISRTIMNAVLNGRKAVLSQDAGNDLNLPTSASIADLRIRSFMCAPLLASDGQPLGILQIDTTDRQRFTQDDLDLLVAVAGQAAISIQNAAMHENLLARDRIDRDLRLAEQVQRRFLPQSLPKVDGYQFFAHYRAAYEVGGDFYDFLSLSPERVGLALGDVSGKGVAAALMMAKFSGDTRFCLVTEPTPAAACNRLNQLLCHAGFEERFITLCLGTLDLTARSFTFSSAGHLPVLVRRADGQVEEFGELISGFPLGIVGDATYEETTISLEPGDVVVVYSDGVTDARSKDEQLFHTNETPRLTRRLAASAGGPEAVGKAILQDIREFSEGQPQADDISILCFGPVAR